MEANSNKNVPDPAWYLTLAELGEQQRSTGAINFREAGRKLGLEHATIISHIKKLSEYHRTTITASRKKTPRLTPEGVHLAALANLLRGNYSTLCEHRSFGRPVLRLGAFHTSFRSVLPKVLKDLSGTFDLDLIEAQSHAELIENLRTGMTDIAFGWSGEEEKYLPELNEGEMTTVRLGEPCRMVAIASPDLDATFGGRVFETLEEVRKVSKCLILDKEKARQFQETGILKETGSNLILCQTLGNIIALVQRGLGVGIVWDIGDLLQTESVLKATIKKDFRRRLQLVTFWRTEHYKARADDASDPMTMLVVRLLNGK